MKRAALCNFAWKYDRSIFLPLSAGMLTAFCEADAEFNKHYQIDHDFLFVRDDPEKITRQVLDANVDVLGFSTYIWNEALSLDVARRVKAARPETLIIFGGQSISQWPEVNEAFLRANPFIDVAVRGEGEITFKELLLSHAQAPWQWRVEPVTSSEFVPLGGAPAGTSALPGISFLTGRTEFDSPYDSPGNYGFVFGPERKRERDLAIFPSPYLAGTFDVIMSKHPDLDWQGLWETNRGCVYECTFCSWSALALGAKLGVFPMPRLMAELDWFSDKKIGHVYCCDANAGIMPRDVEWVDALVEHKKTRGFPRSFFVNTAKNASKKIFDLAKKLHDAGMSKSLILSMQSMDEATLLAVKRDNIKLSTYHELQKLAREIGMATCSELILGLPGETLESFCNGIEHEIDARQTAIFMYFCVVLPASEMAQPKYIQEHGIQTARVTIAANHADLAENDASVPEYEDVVVATKTMPYEDWLEANRVAWFVYSFFCMGLATFPLLWMKEEYGIRVTDFARWAMGRKPADTGHPHDTARAARANTNKSPMRSAGAVLHREKMRLDAYVESIRSGSPTVPRTRIEKTLPIRWPIEEATFLALSMNLDEFYREFKGLVHDYLGEKGIDFDPLLLRWIFEYQAARIVRHDGACYPTTAFGWNLPEYFDALLRLEKVPLEKRVQSMTVTPAGIPADGEHWAGAFESFDEFSKKGVWFARRGGSFFYPAKWHNIGDTHDAR